MTGKISAKYAFRSIFRHKRRTLVSVIGVGIGCGLGLFAIAWIRGEIEWQIKSIAQSGGGHAKIVPAGWIQKHEDSLRLNDWREVLRQAEALPEAEGVSAHSKTKGILAFGTRMVGVEAVGVQPDKEQKMNRIVQRGKLSGRYLEQGDKGQVVVGAALAKRLDVEVGDDLVFTVAGKKDIQSVMLRVAGIISTGSRDVDLSICHVTIEDIELITGYQGVGEVAVLLSDHKFIEKSIERLKATLPKGDEVISWQEVKPDLTAGIEGDKAYTKVLVAIIIIIVAFGIASAQLTAVLERLREFAVLTALGMKSSQIVALVVMEAILIGLGGAFVGLLIGGSGAYYVATVGVNFEPLIGNMSFGGDILIDYVFHGDFGYWLIWVALELSLGATIAASIYPAWYATRSDPATALRTV